MRNHLIHSPVCKNRYLNDKDNLSVYSQQLSFTKIEEEVMDSILQFDHSVIFYVHEHLVYSFLTPIMAIISKITSNGALWILIALLLMIQKKYRVLGVAIIIALGFVFIIGDQGLKPNVARLRPFVDFPNVTVPLESALPKATSFSFPSGHSFGSFASAMTIYLGLSQIAPQKRYLGILALVLSVVVAFSRVYLFVHYPTDVLTGLVLGIIVGFIAWKLARVGWNWWINRNNDVEYEPYTFKRK